MITAQEGLRSQVGGARHSLTLRMVDGASYGAGVIANAYRLRVPNVVGPRIRPATWPRAGHAPS